MKLEEGGLSSSPGVVLYPAYCLINHACRWTQLEQSSKSDLSCFYIFTIFPLGLIWASVLYLFVSDLFSNNTNYQKLPDLSLELRSQVPIRKGEEISTRWATFQQILQIKGTFLFHFYQRYVSSTVGNFRRKRDIAKYWFFKWEKKLFQNSKLQNLLKFSAFPAATVHGAVILLSWAPTCEDSLKKET